MSELSILEKLIKTIVFKKGISNKDKVRAIKTLIEFKEGVEK